MKRTSHPKPENPHWAIFRRYSKPVYALLTAALVIVSFSIIAQTLLAQQVLVPSQSPKQQSAPMNPTSPSSSLLPQAAEAQAPSPTESPTPSPLSEAQATRQPMPNTATRKATLLWKYGTGGHVQRTAVSDPIDSNDDFRIIAGSDDKNIYVFDASGGLLWQRQLEGKVWGASVSPDGRYFSAGTEGGNVYFFDGLGNLLWQNQLSNDAYETGVSRDGDYVVYGSMNWEDSTYSAYLFNKTGSLQWMRTAKDACGVAISDDGKSIVVGADNEFVFLYNASGEQVWKYKTGGEVWGVSMSGDASLVVAGSSDGYVYALDKSGKLLWKYDTGISVWEVSVSRDGQYVASSSEELVCFLNRNGNLIWQKTMASETEGIGLSENGDFLALGSYDGYAYSFDTR